MSLISGAGLRVVVAGTEMNHSDNIYFTVIVGMSILVNNNIKGDVCGKISYRTHIEFHHCHHLLHKPDYLPGHNGCMMGRKSLQHI